MEWTLCSMVGGVFTCMESNASPIIVSHIFRYSISSHNDDAEHKFPAYIRVNISHAWSLFFVSCVCLYSTPLCVFVCVWHELDQSESSWNEGSEAKPENLPNGGTQQWIGNTFDAVRKINQNDFCRESTKKFNMGLASWLRPHERVNQCWATSWIFE